MHACALRRRAADRNAAWGIVLAIGISAVVGLMYVVALMFSIQAGSFSCLCRSLRLFRVIAPGVGSLGTCSHARCSQPPILGLIQFG